MSALDRGVFTLSLDFELIWGTLDLFGPEGFRHACEAERAVVIDRLLGLLTEFEISATWCVLGHLFLDRCSPVDGRTHPEIVRPAHSWCRGDWLEHDSGGTERTHPIFFGRSLVEKIRACAVRQEIGCHSFSHVIFGDPGCSRAAAESEVAACVRLAQEMGLDLRSFAFPRNSVGYLDVLREHGFTSYRGPGPRWYERDDSPGPLGRLAHLWDVLTAARPATLVPRMTESGLWDIPGSMIYFPMHGMRRHVPVALRVRRAVKGLDAAVRTNSVFHLWFHPTNFAEHVDSMFAGLRRILEHAAALRQRGSLDVLTMESIASRCLSAG